MSIDKFTEIKKILDFFKPFTPYGRIYKENISIIKEKKEIEKKLDAAQFVIKYIQKNKFRADKIKYHLKNIPYIDFQKENLEIGDIFLYKKFLNNYFSIYQIFEKKEKDFFSLSWQSQELFDYLSISSKTDDFYISEDYDLSLKEIRKKITEINEKIEKEKKKNYEEIKAKTGFDFLNKDFLVVSSASYSENSDYLYFEPYDSYSYIVRPKLKNEILALISEREELIKQEKEIESQIKDRIIEKILKNKKEIIKYSEKILELDIAFATAEMAICFSLSKPQLNSKNIKCKNAFFIPLKLELEKMKIKYTPLSFDFKKRINVITGSNMGGKTIVLKTIAQLQLMAQMGLYVPAEFYSAPVFKTIETTNSENEISGLSSFAMEITNLIDILKKEKPILIFMDEFARTTNIKEGKAIFSAILEEFSQEEDVYLFTATHFSELKTLENMDFLSMKGFDRNKFEKYEDFKTNDFVEKLKIINKCMDYTLVRSDFQISFYDAINIASILGLDKKILNKALKNLEEKKID